MALNDTKLRRISGKAYEGPEEIADGGGLSVRISPKGLITFNTAIVSMENPPVKARNVREDVA